MPKFYQIGLIVLSFFLSSLSYAQVKTYHLTIGQTNININGQNKVRLSINGQFPAPTLYFTEGDEAVIHVHNQLNEETSLHWHGLLLPGIMDGVPGMNGFKGIAPQQDFEYRFKLRQSGTYWYHAHSQSQEQDGLYGAFVILPKSQPQAASEPQVKQDYVVMLSEFHPSRGNQIFKNLKKDGEYYQNQRETLADVWRQVQATGLKATWQDRKMWNQMRMLKTDLSDVTGYQFLVNGHSQAQPWTGEFAAGEVIRLRFINASAMSFFDVRIPGLKMTVISADGQAVKPVSVDEFRIGAAETYDVIVTPENQHYQIQAESVDRSGFALGQLKSKNQPASPHFVVPVSRPRAKLTMSDMGHGTHEMSHDSSAHMNASDLSSKQPIDHDMPAANAHMHSGMNHGAHTSEAIDNDPNVVQGWANSATPLGQKALRYEDLQSLTPQQDVRPPSQEIVIVLDGNMERYIWTMNGKKFSEASPIQVNYGERVRLKFVNNSMMAHPMHLHGMFVQLENGQELNNLPNKHTVIVPPGQTITALLTADELGEWAIHCHLLYHMSAGMMNKLVVAKTNPSSKLSPALASHSNMGADHAHH